MKQFTRGSITLQEIPGGTPPTKLIAVSIGKDLSDPETCIIIPALADDYLDDLVAAIKMYKDSKKKA
jgi:hypothetical protein